MKLQKILITLTALISLHEVNSQTFYFGNDLSYVNQMEDCGAVYKEKNNAKDVYEIFADHGTNLVRVRLWIDPSWWQGPLVQPAGVKPWYNDLEDVKETIFRSKNAGMQVMLGIHYSDFWADPGRQLIPRAWVNAAYDLNALKDTVYNYTFHLLSELESEGLMPEFIKVGNENNPGILKHIPEENGYEIKATVSSSWSRHAALFNSAIQAIRDISSTTEVQPKIAIHFTGNLSDHKWMFQNLINNGVTDFDIMGISYYYAWHKGSISDLESTIRSLKQTFTQYDVMVVETGYLWSTQNFDPLGNIINIPDPDYLPVIPEKQLEYMIDYTRAVMKGGGIGVIFWEPAWVSTPCRTPWGTGSSHDHVVFFDPVNTNFMENGGGMWMQSPYYTDLETKKITFKVDMTGVDASEGVYLTGSFTGSPWQIIPMVNEGNGIYSYYTYLQPGSEGGFYFLNGPDWTRKESIPSECLSYQDSSRIYSLSNNDKVYSLKWNECSEVLPDSVLVSFVVDMTGIDVSRGVYLTGHPTGDPWKIVPLSMLEDNIYTWSTYLKPGDEGAYYFLTTPTWDNYISYRESVPAECAEWWDSDRGYKITSGDTTIAVRWESCQSFTLGNIFYPVDDKLFLFYPNPAVDFLNIKSFTMDQPFQIEIFNMQGIKMRIEESAGFQSEKKIPVVGWPVGIYLCNVTMANGIFSRKILIKRSF